MDIQELRQRVNEINENDIQDELAKQAGMQSFISELFVQAEMAYRLTKGKKYEEIRASIEAGGKKATENMVEMAMLADGDLQTVRAKREMLKALKDSVYTRGNMLIQLAISKRQDLENQVTKIAC